MSLSNGEFVNVGDSLVLKMSPIIDTLTINSFTDIVNNSNVNRTFIKEFRYSLDNLTFNSFRPLTNLNLAALTLIITTTYYFEIKYTRTGSDTTGSLFWENICFNMTVVPKNLLRINKSNYDTVFGGGRWEEIQFRIQEFNLWSIKKFGEVIYTVIDPTVPNLQQYLTIPDAQKDHEFNSLFSKAFGNQFLSEYKKMILDTNKGFESQNLP